jgi:two-component system cell cycle response regulator DivK
VGKRVLVVEDNELNLKLFCDLLRVHGHVSEPVRDGREAHARTRDFQPDLIIMDIQLPYVSGLDLIVLLKGDAALRHIPIMAVTAFAAKGDEERIREAGAEAYVSKPISVMKFIQSVNGLLETVKEAAVVEASMRDEGSAETAGEELADISDQSDPIDRHPRESGDPASSSSPPAKEGQLDSRVRGNDEEEGTEEEEA